MATLYIFGKIKNEVSLTNFRNATTRLYLLLKFSCLLGKYGNFLNIEKI